MRHVDIETIPTQRGDVRDLIRSRVSAPSNYKDPEKIQKYIEEATPAELDKTALSGLFGEIWCIAWADDDGEIKSITRKELDDSEGKLISAFLQTTPMPSPRWCGWNVGWDLRFLQHRCWVHQIYRGHVDFGLDAKPWEAPYVDLMARWCGFRDRAKLSDVALALGIDGKHEGIDGSQVWPLVQAGEWVKVEAYCRQDVEMVRQIQKRLI